MFLFYLIYPILGASEAENLETSIGIAPSTAPSKKALEKSLLSLGKVPGKQQACKTEKFQIITTLLQPNTTEKNCSTSYAKKGQEGNINFLPEQTVRSHTTCQDGVRKGKAGNQNFHSYWAVTSLLLHSVNRDYIIETNKKIVEANRKSHQRNSRHKKN